MKRTVAAEQFFTSGSVVEQCPELLARHFALSEFDLIVEPSAGAGAFLLRLPPEKRIGFDILPMHDDVTAQDFLAWSPQSLAAPMSTGGKTLTIGNPPFGRRGKLAVQFISKAATYSDVFAFILPRSFNKYTFQNRVPANFHLVDSLNVSDFETPAGEPLQICSVFQIWEKRAIVRSKNTAPRTHPDFDLRHAHMSRVASAELAALHREYDFAIPQVGITFIPHDAATITKGSYWFIKPHTPYVRQVFENLDFSFLDNTNTVLKSLARSDIIAAYNTGIATAAMS